MTAGRINQVILLARWEVVHLAIVHLQANVVLDEEYSI